MIYVYPAYCDKETQTYDKSLCGFYTTFEWIGFILILLILLFFICYVVSSYTLRVRNSRWRREIPIV
uniref:ORF2 p8 n=1 Tax=Lettuce chlorosis virus TaxID=642478 RepID=A0A5C1IUF1_9CLOS|nr:ORF2 p8 [Lettuce chlorosis virus]